VAPESLLPGPFLAIWQGLSHPEIDWHSHLHFDWKGFGDMALSGGIAAGGSKDFASYAVVGADYLNLNMRFGFHFTLIDCLCGAESRANYCQLRFAGGGGDYEGRSVRIILLQRILGRLGFEVSVRGDLLDARLIGYPADELRALLVEVGRLLGMTKLLDMVLHEEEIEQRVEQFFHGTGRLVDPSTSFHH
jgi:pyruvate, water dikinase